MIYKFKFVEFNDIETSNRTTHFVTQRFLILFNSPTE